MKYIGAIPNQNQQYYQASPPQGLGYYNGYYGYQQYPYYQTYDPFEIRRRQEEEYKRQQTIRNGQIESMKALMKANCHFFGEEFDEESYDEYYSENNQFEINRDMQMHNSIHSLKQNVDYQVSVINQQMQQIHENGYPTQVKDESLLEFLEGTARDELIAITEAEYVSINRQAVGSLYNKPGYNELLEIHRANRFLDPNATIDDMEIGLPAHLRNTRDERRERFMKALLANGGGING